MQRQDRVGGGRGIKGLFRRALLPVWLAVGLLCSAQPAALRAAPLRQAGELTPGYWERSALPEMGLATYYAAGTMEWVWQYRLSRGEVAECPECVGAVALLRAGDIGRKVWLQPPGGELAGPFMVVDCARTEDVPPLVGRAWVVDVSYELGQLWGMTRPLDGVIVWADPAEGNAPPAPGSAPPVYIDPNEVVVTAPTATPEAAAAPLTGWPTRLPVARGTVVVSAPDASTAAAVTPPPVVLQPMEGTPTITAPTPTPGPANVEASGAPVETLTPPAAPPVPPTALAASAAEAVEALGRPGADLISRPTVSVASLAAAARPTTTPRPTRDPARPTSTPLLARPSASPSAGGSAPGGALPAALPPALSQDDASALGRLWQAFLHLIGR